MDGEDIIRDDVNLEIHKQIYKCFLKFGLEGTEDKIKDLYYQMPELKEKWLSEYYKIIRG